MSPTQLGRPGFRLVDLLAVLFLVAVLIGLLMPTAHRVRGGDEARSRCMNNLKQIGLGVHNYAATYNNALPPLASDRAKPKYGAYNGGILFTLLPFIEQQVMYQSGTQLEPQAVWSAPIPPSSNTTLTAANLPLQSAYFKVFLCWADPTVVKWSANQVMTSAAAGVYPWGASSYAANYQLFGTTNDLPDDGATVTAERNNACGPKYDIGKIPDGSSNTLMFGEQLAACGTAAGNLWAYPGIGNYAARAYAPQPAGSGIVNAPGSPGTTTSKLWAPVFANSHPRFGFAGGGHEGSIFQNNANAAGADPPPAQIKEPYGLGLYWDAPPQDRAAPAGCDKSRLQTLHGKGAVVAMADGSVRVLSDHTSQPTWYAAIMPDDGAPLGEDWNPTCRGRPGFRMVDLLVVLFVLIVLLGLLLPVMRRTHVYADRLQCTNNLKQIGLAIHNYAAAHKNALPALTCDRAKAEYGDYNGGLFFTLLPFLEEADLQKNTLSRSPQAVWAAPISRGTNLTTSATNPPLQAARQKIFVCPGDPDVLDGQSANQATLNLATGVYPWAASSYAANYQLFGTVNDLPDDGATVTAEQSNFCGPTYNIGNIPDGSSNTLMFGEQFSACGTTAGTLWAYPGIGNYAATNYAPRPTGPGIVNQAGSPGATTSRFWAPVFANNHPRFGFAAGGHAGSIYLYNKNAAGADSPTIGEPYGTGLYWDAPPQDGAFRWTCDKSRLQSAHGVPGRQCSAVLVCMGDCSTRIVSAQVSQPTWYSAIVPDDGVPLGADW
jgi:prepilin-type processing-associated H-X9-DG protein